MNNNRFLITILAISLFFCRLASASFTKKPCVDLIATHHIHTILSSPKTRVEFSGFMDNVLRQIPSNRFFSTIESYISLDKPETDANLYPKIKNEIERNSSYFKIFHQFKALNAQKKELSQQAQQLIGEPRHINGCLEIGQPATYINSMKKFLSISGPIYALNEASYITDYFQAGTLRPYTHFIPLNGYAPIDPVMIKNNSIDLIVCVIGLHHIPQEKLIGFINSLHRILRPGGIFILREHDAHSPELVSMVHTAHSIFNAIIPNLELDEELNEYRNFQPLIYWIELLERHNFIAQPLRLTQQGDPTLNTMMAFTKQAQSEEDNYLEFSTTIKKQPEYLRNELQTHLTTPEWLNVDVSKEYGKFIEHTPFYEFPYIASVKSYWHTFIQSWKTAAKKRGHLNVLTSPYTLMNLFIGATMSVEYGLKSMISLPMRLMYADEEPKTIKAIISDPLDEIEQIDNRIHILATYKDSCLKLIEVPRYKEFLNVIHKLAKTSNVVIREIGGQKAIQFKVRYQQKCGDNQFVGISGCKKEYTWTLPTQPDYVYAALTVEIEQMLNVINNLNKQDIELIYIHDF